MHIIKVEVINKQTMLLRNKDRDLLLKILSTANIPFEVWAYGSRVSGEAHDGSDLDLVIRSQNLQKIPIDILNDLREKIGYSNIPIVVELFDWSRLPESFQRNIETQYEVLFSNLGSTVSEPSVNYSNEKKEKNMGG